MNSERHLNSKRFRRQDEAQGSVAATHHLIPGPPRLLPPPSHGKDSGAGQVEPALSAWSSGGRLIGAVDYRTRQARLHAAASGFQAKRGPAARIIARVAARARPSTRQPDAPRQPIRERVAGPADNRGRTDVGAPSAIDEVDGRCYTRTPLRQAGFGRKPRTNQPPTPIVERSHHGGRCSSERAVGHRVPHRR